MSGFVLKITEPLAGRIRAHGVETYPHECCGAILAVTVKPPAKCWI